MLPVFSWLLLLDHVNLESTPDTNHHSSFVIASRTCARGGAGVFPLLGIGRRWKDKSTSSFIDIILHSLNVPSWTIEDAIHHQRLQNSPVCRQSSSSCTTRLIPSHSLTIRHHSLIMRACKCGCAIQEDVRNEYGGERSVSTLAHRIVHQPQSYPHPLDNPPHLRHSEVGAGIFDGTLHAATTNRRSPMHPSSTLSRQQIPCPSLPTRETIPLAFLPFPPLESGPTNPSSVHPHEHRRFSFLLTHGQTFSVRLLSGDGGTVRFSIRLDIRILRPSTPDRNFESQSHIPHPHPHHTPHPHHHLLCPTDPSPELPLTTTMYAWSGDLEMDLTDRGRGMRSHE
ncbi:hypothetical protein Hypma_011285 [Hypsizygus marmoreus]|uniref:Uncharacterized protein n=1 Tax=Hypsizygus marmoreus TaxID=39966 RepID=A0A369JQJ0_HYPMA|nr:hypothetical protein Hypma_011285 [Hypsizygus marmoreus]